MSKKRWGNTSQTTTHLALKVEIAVDGHLRFCLPPEERVAKFSIVNVNLSHFGPDL